MVRLLRSEKSRLPAALLSFMITAACMAQGEPELQAYRDKYQGYAVLHDLQEKDVTITMGKNGLPVTSIRNYASVLVLTNHAAAFAESKEYFNPQVKMESLKAYSRVPEGKSFRDIEVKHFVKSSEINDGLFYDDVYAYQFTFPAVSAGTRLITESVVLFDDPYYPVIYRFGGGMPSEISRLRVRVSEAVQLRYRLFGLDTSMVRHTVSKAGKNLVHTWEASLPEAYTGDEVSPASQYFVPHIIVHIVSYEHRGQRKTVMDKPGDLYDWYYGNIRQLDSLKSPEIDRFVDTLIMDCHDEAAKVRSIFSWVQQQIRYVAIEDGTNAYIPREASLVFKRRYGDCKDKSSLLRYMLRAAGLKAGLAWVGTRELPYSYADFPSMAVDNHMVCVWWSEKGEPVVLDATTRNHIPGEVPASIQGKECLVEKGPSDHALITLPVEEAEKNQVVDTFRLYFRDDKLLADVITNLTGENRISLLSLLQATEKHEYDKLIPGMIKFASNKFIARNVEYKDRNHNGQALTLTYSLEMPDYDTRQQDAVYVNLHLVRLFQKDMIKPGRRIPYQADHCYSYKQVCILEIPDGWKVGALPSASAKSFPGFGFEISYTQSANKVVMTSGITMNRLIVEGQELEDLRSFLVELNKASLNTVVLNK